MSTPSDNNAPATTDLQTLLDEPPKRVWWRRRSTWIGVVVLLLLIGAWAFWRAGARNAAGPSFVTEPVTRGDLAVTVVANGTLQPTRTVSIGSELSGTVAQVFVDVNDQVRKGQILLQLDVAKLQDQIVRSRATLASAEASVAQNVAGVKEAQSNLARLEEVAKLSGGKVPSQSELDTARATLEKAQANEAAARATVQDAKAALSTDETNLSKASIRSPTDGVILTRSVDPGNAVAASLQAVTLFTIAEDLRKLKLQVSVDEADVGTVKNGQTATFTVAAYPRRKYPAVITRVAYGSTTTDNVVTYTTYLDVDNTDLSLRPGMTATATIASAERHGVVLVPNTALRFTPASATSGGAPGATEQGGSGGGIVASLMPRMPAPSARKNNGTDTNPQASGARQVWILRNGQPAPVNVVPGLTDGHMTEVTSTELEPNMQVITDQRAGAAK
jgi:HlyD family secretion protein